MASTEIRTDGKRVVALLLAGTVLGGLSQPLFAQEAPVAAQAPSVAPLPAVNAPMTRTVQSLGVEGSQRIEPDTIRSYIKLRVGQQYTNADIDQAIKDLYNTELFADVQIGGVDTGNLVIQVRENPVINRIVLEGNKRLKEDKIRPEIKLAPRQIYTRSKVRADVARIIELYRRQGRFGATIDPKLVQLDQNRVDIVFEIHEGPKSKVRQINIIGNHVFSDDDLRGEMATKQARWFRFLSSRTTYDPDRLAYDQQKLRQFYLTEGYADFRVISAVAELTPNKQDFIITYVVEEGDRYKFGDVSVQSDIRDLKADRLQATLPMHTGDWYNAKQIEDTVDNLTQSAGLFGYAFAQVDPQFDRHKEDKTMDIKFVVNNSPRVYVERINVNGNTLTKDKVVRREFRLAEGDAFNTFQVKRSTDRIKSLGYFQEDLEVEQKPGSGPDRVVLEANVQEKSTGELQLSAGFSSLERFILQASITQRNFRGMGQELRLGANYSYYSKSVNLGFTEPYLFDRNISLSGDLFRQDYSNFYLTGDDRDTTYKQVSTGFQVSAGLALTEYWGLRLSYRLSVDDVTLDKSTYYSDLNGDGQLECDPLRAGRYLCEAIGNRTTSSLGYTIIYDDRDNRVRPTRGQNFYFGQTFAGLGGSVKYLKTNAQGAKYWPLGGGFVGSLSLEGGYIFSLEGKRTDDAGNEIDPVRLVDRFYLGEGQIRGFDIRGIGPRILRQFYNSDGTLNTDRKNTVDDALGGHAYYLGRAEVQIPLGSSGSELGLRPSIFVDVGAVWGVKKPQLTTFPVDEDGNPQPIYRNILDKNGNVQYVHTGADDAQTVTPCQFGVADGSGNCPTSGTANPLYQQTVQPFKETFVGDTPKPRVSVGFGVNWNSPFGPFRIDIAKALITAEGDDPKLITFNVGTQF